MAHGPVQLENPFRIVSGLLMKIVDILGDDSPEPAPFFKTGEGVVGPVRLGPGEVSPLEEKFPLLFSRFLIVEKFFDGEIGGVEPGPEAPGAPEIGNPRLGADSSAGKRHDLSRLDDQVRRLIDLPVRCDIRHATCLFSRILPCRNTGCRKRRPRKAGLLSTFLFRRGGNFLFTARHPAGISRSRRNPHFGEDDPLDDNPENENADENEPFHFCRFPSFRCAKRKTWA